MDRKTVASTSSVITKRPRKSAESRLSSVSLYAWGDNSHGQLGLGKDGGAVSEPARLPGHCVGGGGVRNVCGGERHSLLLREDGCLLACGANECGQLGGGSSNCGGGRFSQVTPLESKRIVCVSAGGSHSLAVDESGQVFAWGKNHRCQLGREDTESTGVRLIRHLSEHQASQVSAGLAHSLVLTAGHLVFAFGDNSRGQLGQGDFKPRPTAGEASGCLSVASLLGLPVGRVVCGGQHCLALSCSGVLFAWGANAKGQLGCGSTEDQAWPVQCRTLRGQLIRHVTCGLEHSAALTAEGGVFTFGSGEFGQLGHGQLGNNEVLPRRVADLMGSAVTQLSCGRHYTLAYVPSATAGRVYAFGAFAASPAPAVVPPTWASPAESPAPPAPQAPVTIYSAGDCAFLKAALVATSPTSSATVPDDFRSGRPSWLAPSAELLRLDDCLDGARVRAAAATLAAYNCAFLRRPLTAPSRADHGVDLDAAAERLDSLGREISKEAEAQLLDGLSSLLHELAQSNRTNYPDIECLRFFLLAPLVHLFARPELFSRVHTGYAQCLNRLDPVPRKIVAHWLGQLPTRHFARMLRTFKAVARYVLELPKHASRAEAEVKERGLGSCMQLLRLLHEVNASRAEALACGNFYMPELNTKVDITRDYILWSQHRGQAEYFSFCDFPFVFDGAAKTKLLRADAYMKMQHAVQQAQQQNLMAMVMNPAGMVNPHLLLQVRRDNIVGDAISHLSKFPPEELRKPLRVKFVGEDAEDQGGVSKEFFQLIFREILNPLYGMFRSYDSRLIWFNFGSLEDASLFHLIGILCGLAIYNDFLAGVAFPLAMYKKLLDRRPALDDLKELDPIVGRNLQLLLELESPQDVDALTLTFEIEVDYYGELRRLPLGEKPDEPVAIDNRQRYVDAYVDFVFTAGCKEPYAAFHDGFHKVCGGPVLRMFEPAELQTMLVGEADNFHWEELEKNAEYLGVYFAKHEVIVHFWSVFHRDLNEAQKRKFLHFLTGCDRVPMQGMSAVKIRIQPVHGGGAYLPVAHTCYNLLDLPMYPDRESLRVKLTQAIEQTEGFALV